MAGVAGHPRPAGHGRRRLALAALLVAVFASGAATAAEDLLQVLHWWSSASERKAANALVNAIPVSTVTTADRCVDGPATKVIDGRGRVYCIEADGSAE